MRIEVLHEETLTWTPPVPAANLALRATPRDDEGQNVLAWRVEVEGGAAARLARGEDAFGNLGHRVTIDGPVGTVLVRAEGVVATEETHGVLRGTREHLPPGAYLRERPGLSLTPEIETYAASRAGEGSLLSRLHALLAAVHGEFGGEGPGEDDPARVLTAGRGTARGLATLFAVLAIAADAPARIAEGWVAGEDALRPWAEAFVPGLGWVGFDPALGVCTTLRHLRLRTGLDAPSTALGRARGTAGAAPTRSAAVRVAAS